ncbi:MAG: DUF5683 domain-containing protein [Bacteroidales bacterium]|nr:DUF5683 domain-containing protein [Bacteroidales bacterium]
MTLKEVLLSIFLLFLSLCVQGQIENDSIEIKPIKDTIQTKLSPKYTKVELDSIMQAKLSIKPETSPIQKDLKINNLKLYHSPTRATLYSLLPGLGQIYNKQAWKVPIIYAAEGAVAYFAITNYKGAQKFKTEYKLRANGIEEGRNPDYENYPDQSILNIYYAYQKNFELSIMGGALVYVFNLVDAMVYAHLFDYDISPNLSLNLSPYCLPSIYSSPTVGLSMRFNLK